MIKAKIAMLALAVIILCGNGVARAQILGTYHADQLMIELLEMDCRSENTTTFIVNLENQGVDPLWRIKLVCVLYNECCEVGYQIINMSLPEILHPESNMIRTLLIKHGCPEFDRVEFRTGTLR